ncbi:MAG: DNA polymerase-3 subunit delta' [Janthinobacterium sp.]|jgi:DNA polymerase-3 subunit delta'
MGSLLYPWQQDAWLQLQQLRARMPHAILFHGAAGIGKADFIEHYAQSLLCEDVRADGQACALCPSCGWFSQQNHPDYRRLRPEALEDEAPPDGEEGGDGSKKSAKSTKTPSKEIKIEQVRALSDFMNVSTHRQGLRVVVLYPAEALNTPASNALLKTLEEPPPGTVILLATHSLDRVLPTILSRCRKFALAMPSHQQALNWLVAQGVQDAGNLLSEQGGAPLAAQAQAQADNGSREQTQALLQFLAQPSIDGALRTAEKLQKSSLGMLVSCLQRWLHDLFSAKLAGKIRYYPRYQAELIALAAKVHVSALMGVVKRANDRRAIAEHPLSPKLFIEDMLLDYAACWKDAK